MTLPPVYTFTGKRKYNATHTIFGIWIREGLPYFDAILAQEKFEWWYLRKCGALCALPFVIAAIVVGGMESVLIGLVAFAAFLLGPRFPANLRKMELIGHMIEYLWATEKNGADPERYFQNEALAICNYRQFDGWSLDRIKAGMLEVEPIARKYV